MKKVTVEITDYCSNGCSYCSSNTTKFYEEAKFIDPQTVIDRLEELGREFETIIISGGEPLAHPKFYQILQICKDFGRDVIVYTNALTHIAYNSNVIDGIYLEANLTILPNVNKVRLLKRIQQGKEKTRPEVKFSNNFMEDCQCDNRVIKPDGKVALRGCNKHEFQ